MWKEAVVAYLEVLSRHLPLNRVLSDHKSYHLSSFTRLLRFTFYVTQIQSIFLSWRAIFPSKNRLSLRKIEVTPLMLRIEIVLALQCHTIPIRKKKRTR
jgi:hypothetical protein